MKSLLSYSIPFLLLNVVVAQCPNSGLKIQGPICDSAKILKIVAVTCSLLKIKWQGQTQTYHIKASGIDRSTGKAYEAEAKNYSCDSHGNCTATIPVKAGSKVNWSVQGVCEKDNNTLDSYQKFGPEVVIPVCEPPIVTSSQTVHAYPNPTIGILNVDYSGKITTSTKVLVSDIAGKKAFIISGGALNRTSTGFRLDLHGVLNGTYILHIQNGKDQSQVKFVLVRN